MSSISYAHLFAWTESRQSVKAQALFAKRMAFLVRAGVPLVDALSLISKQTTSESLARVYESLVDDVTNGKLLAESLGKHERMFGGFAIQLIRIGEESGMLADNLEYLSEELKKKDALRRKVLGALAYPFIIIIATFGITGALLLYVFPKILPIFSSLHVTLPLSTRILIAVSGFLSHFGGLLFLSGVGGVLGCLVLIRKYSRVKLFMHKTVLSVPIFGNMITCYELANFTRTLGLLLQSGVPVSRAMEMVSDATRNLAYRRAFHRVTESIMRGEQISRELAEESLLFPELLVHMIIIGESTGSLAQTLLYLSDMYDSEVEEQTKNLSTAIEPALMLIMGLLVGFIAVSIISPIYAITENLHS